MARYSRCAFKPLVSNVPLHSTQRRLRYLTLTLTILPVLTSITDKTERIAMTTSPENAPTKEQFLAKCITNCGPNFSSSWTNRSCILCERVYNGHNHVAVRLNGCGHIVGRSCINARCEACDEADCPCCGRLLFRENKAQQNVQDIDRLISECGRERDSKTRGEGGQLSLNWTSSYHAVLSKCPRPMLTLI